MDYYGVIFFSTDKILFEPGKWALYQQLSHEPQSSCNILLNKQLWLHDAPHKRLSRENPFLEKYVIAAADLGTISTASHLVSHASFLGKSSRTSLQVSEI
jgi:hypothetical protein